MFGVSTLFSVGIKIRFLPYLPSLSSHFEIFSTVPSSRSVSYTHLGTLDIKSETPVDDNGKTEKTIYTLVDLSLIHI